MPPKFEPPPKTKTPKAKKAAEYSVQQKQHIESFLDRELDARRGGSRQGKIAPVGASMQAVDIRDERLGLNEAIFRELNERLEGLGRLGRLFGRDEPLDFLCECTKVTCAQRIEMSRKAYQAVRADDTHFALYPGHADTEIELVIESRPAYEVVAKRGPAADVAHDLSPR